MNLECCEQTRFGQSLASVEDLHDRIHATAVPFPHRSEPRLATEIPAEKCQSAIVHIYLRMCITALGHEPFQRDMSFLDALHVEAYSRY
jgi:hypothetical protein